MVIRRVLCIFATVPMLVQGYSVLSHEAIIDGAWDIAIRPVLLQRFPSATKEELLKAHAYAYGGAIMPDLGYYPFGSEFFSDLAHYVRGGDFVENLISQSQDLNEYAFALGAAAHYVADSIGHPIAINRAVPMLYPKLRQKFGPIVTYEDSKAAHLKTEFAFDVAQVAHQRYGPKAYHDFIGFEVSKPVLERAFAQTYGIKLSDIVFSVDLAIGTFRFSASSLIPEMTRVAWVAKKGELERATPGLTKDKFVYNLSRSSFEKEWGNEYKRPGIFARILAFLFRILPKVGPLKAFGFEAPTPETEKLFMASFNQTIASYRSLLSRIGRGENVKLRNENFDTGKPLSYGSYRLADKTFGELVRKLADKTPAVLDPSLKSSIEGFYGKDRPRDRKVAVALSALSGSE
jgi:hypothetical protein